MLKTGSGLSSYKSMVAANFLVLLFLSLASISGAADQQRILVLVSVKHEDLSRDFYVFETFDALWYSTDKLYLKDYIRSEYGAEKFSTSIVRRPYCYLYYGLRENGRDRHFSATNYTSMKDVRRDSESKRRSGYEVLGEGCNDGVPSQALIDRVNGAPVESNQSLIKPFTAETLNQLLFVKGAGSGLYSCSGDEEAKKFDISFKGKSIIFQNVGSSVKSTTSVRNSVFDSPTQEVLDGFIADVGEAYSFVCSDDEIGQKNFMNGVLVNLRRQFEDKYKSCVETSDKADSDCKEYLRRMSSLAERG